jgi:class 3 adenylate cyclase/tetratricopeptide (TPR) repeat protein
MSAERQQLEAGIAALEAQRALLGDAVVDAMLAPARARLAALADSPLASPAEPAQALKQVSILFLDVVGSTTLSQHLDPEAISAVMDDALARGTTVVQAHGGKVLQYAGDNILAAFGADEAREDDAERAVHCGLALLALGRTLGAEVMATHGHAGFDVRVGVHTGGVLLGGGVDAEGSIRGIAVNIAARLEQAAPAGALRISHDTYAQVRGLFEVEAQAPLAVKGVDAPVVSYLVRSARPRSFRIGTRGIEGVSTRMIGRDAELQALQAAHRRLFEQPGLAVVTVVAEAGIGKSRLLYEFEAWSEEHPESFFLFRGRATLQTGAQAFGLLRDIIAWRFQIFDDDSIASARSKLENGIAPLFLEDDGPEMAEAHAHLLGHLIGIDWKDSRHLRGILDDPRQIRNRAFHAAAQVFRRVGARGGAPVVLQLEDLHWADAESLEFLQHLFEVDSDVSMLVLSFARPTLFERVPGWPGPPARQQRIDLQPLGRAASQKLAGELLKKLPEVPAALAGLLTGKAEGNPFYMEELVKMLIDQGAILTRSGDEDTWQINAERLQITQVPSTLTGVLQARLDGLPTLEKQALQHASIVGAVFWDQALAAVQAEAADQLPALVQRELTLPRADGQLDGLREFAFRHQLLHQVTYDTVLKRHKREGHALVAKWLASITLQGGLRAGDVLGLAAEHFELAGDTAQAANFHTRAAEQAGGRLAHERVLAHVERALALLETKPAAIDEPAELRWRLLAVREKTLFLQGRRDEQLVDLDGLAQVADLLDDDRRRADVALRRAVRAMRMADWPAVDSAASACAACAARAGDNELRLRAQRYLAFANLSQGQVEEGMALAQSGLREARALGLRTVEGMLLNFLSYACGQQHDELGSQAYNREILLIFRETGDRVAEAVTLQNLGDSRRQLGDLSQALRDLEAALQMLRAHGDRAVEGMALTNLASVALWQGDAAQAQVLARSALELTAAARARDSEILASLQLAEAEMALGLHAAARDHFAQSLRIAREIDDPAQHDASAGLARVALAEGDAAGAIAALQAVKALLDAGGTLEGTEYPRLIELTLHHALARVGDPEAVQWLERAHRALMADADAIAPDLGASERRMFLENIPHHREIVAAWAARHPLADQHGPNGP